MGGKRSDVQSGMDKAVAAAGSQSALARLLKVAPQSVHGWVARGYPPAERVLQIEEVTGVSRHELRPDLYPRSRAA